MRTLNESSSYNNFAEWNDVRWFESDLSSWISNGQWIFLKQLKMHQSVFTIVT